MILALPDVPVGRIASPQLFSHRLRRARARARGRGVEQGALFLFHFQEKNQC